MKKLPILLTALGLLIGSLIGQAQTAGSAKVTGTVSGTQKIIEAATVSLLRAKDSAVVKLAITGKSGNFEIEKVKQGSYLVSVQAIGFKKYYSETFQLNEGGSQEFRSIELTATNK
jgi:iron complex outermembrane recepter protein